MGCRVSAVRNRVAPPENAAPAPTTTSPLNSNVTTLHSPRDTISTSLHRRSSKNGGNEKATSMRTMDGEDNGGYAHPQNSDSSYARHVSSGSQRISSALDAPHPPSPRAVSPRGKKEDKNHLESAATRLSTQPENHFEPLPMSTQQQQEEQSGVREVSSEECIATFRTEIEAHEKTDSAQAAKEYQQHLQARRSAEVAHKKRRQLEEFDPVRPVDSFNVTHRGLLGRCWDRRAPELIPISFVYALEAALGVTEERQVSCTTSCHPPGPDSGIDEYPPASPYVSSTGPHHAGDYLPDAPGRRSQQHASVQSSLRTGPGPRRIPRRSHWFSVGGVSCDAMARPHSSSVPLTTTTWSGAHAPRFPLSAPLPAPSPVGSSLAIGAVKSSLATTASSPLLYGSGINVTAKEGSPDNPTASKGCGDARLREPLTFMQISTLSMEEREHYLNEFLMGNPRFMGIKNRFAFRLADGVSEDASTKFLRKRNLQPAPGVKAVRWNHVEFFNPSLRTLIRAVDTTQGKKPSAEGRNFYFQHGRLGCPPISASQLHLESGDGGNGEGNTGGASTGLISSSSFSQCVILQMENRSFSGGGTLNTLPSYLEGQRSTGDTSASYNNSFGAPQRSHHNQSEKDTSIEASLSRDAFPEDSVLSLALCIPTSHLPRMSGAPSMFQLGGVGSPSNCCLAPPTVTRSSRNGTGGPAAPQSPSDTPSDVSTQTCSDGNVLVALCVNSFSVSIDPFHWQENRYIRYPVDVDNTKKSSRQMYGEGLVTSVMYGGIMVVEGSSVAAVNELQALLTSMTWTEGRSLQGAMGDVRKHLKIFQGSRTKDPRPPNGVGAGSQHDSGAQQHQAAAKKDHRYRIWRRIGGRPMRDAVELQEICYFFDDVKMRQETVTLNRPVGPDATITDPDITPSFSRVASVWVKLPVIAAVLRTWGLHLLSSPEFAQPTAMYLQKYAGIAPVLQLTALSGLCHEGSAPNEKIDEKNDDDDDVYHFFEGNWASVTAPHVASTTPDDATHPQPTRQSPELTRFHTSQCTTPSCMENTYHTMHPTTNMSLQLQSSDHSDVQSASESLAPLRTFSSSSGKPLGSKKAANAKMRQRSSAKTGLDVLGGMGPKRTSLETLEGEAAHLSESANRCWTASGVTLSSESPSKHLGSSAEVAKGRHYDARDGPVSSWGKSGLGKAGSKPDVTLQSPDSFPGGWHNVLEHSRRRTKPQLFHDDLDIKSGCFTSMTPSLPVLGLEAEAEAKHGTNEFTGNTSSLISSRTGTTPPQINLLPNSISLMRSTGSLGTLLSSSPAEISKTAPATSMSVTPALTAAAASPSVDTLAFDDSSYTAVANVKASITTSTLDPFCSGDVVSRKGTSQAASGSTPKAADDSQCSSSESKKCISRPHSSVVMNAETPPLRQRRTTASPAILQAAAASTLEQAVQRSDVNCALREPGMQSAVGGTTARQRKNSTVAAATGASKRSRRGVKVTSKCKKKNAAEKTVAPVTEAGTLLGNSAEGLQAARHDLPSPSAIAPNLEIKRLGQEIPRAHTTTVSEEEALWHMAMLEVKARQQELNDLRQACRAAEDTAKQRQDELRSLNRILLPQTTPQELESVLMYLKTAIHEPEDLPHGRLFLPQANWLPMLAAVWTAPTNCIRAVEIAADLTWVDIPRLGVVAGMLYCQYASGPLEELTIRADKLLGFPRNTATLSQHSAMNRNLEDGTVGSGSKVHLLTSFSNKWKRGRNKSYSNGTNKNSRGLSFTTELDQWACAFGPGCPPFLITPEKARDTLWLLLCSVAANTTVPTFRVVLRGLPTGELSTVSGSSSTGRTRNHGKDPKHSTRFASFLAGAAARLQNEVASSPPFCKTGSVGLDGFIVWIDSPQELDQDVHGPVQQSQKRGTSSSPSRNDTIKEEQPHHVGGPIRFSENDAGGKSSLPPHRSCTTPRQSSFLVVMSSPKAAAASSSGTEGSHYIRKEHDGVAGSPSRPELIRNNNFAAARTVKALQTHEHNAQPHGRPWMINGNSTEIRPFYELLIHRREAVDSDKPSFESYAAIAASKLTQQTASPQSPSGHHPNTTDKSQRVHAEPHQYARQQEAEEKLVAASAVTPSGKFPSTATLETPSHLLETLSHPSPSSQLCSDSVPGLRTAAEEKAALLSEVTALRERAADIWEILRKSVKHHNEHQLADRQKATKQDRSSPSPLPPQPSRQIVLEY